MYNCNYENRFVVCIDILGINEKIINKKEKKNLEEFWNIIKNELEDLKEGIELDEAHEGTYKNTLIFSNFAENSQSLKDIIYLLGRVQSNLLIKGILIKGALTIGECYYIDTFFSGSAVDEAYMLLTEKALVPRVVVSEKIKECLNEYNEYELNEIEWGFNKATKDNDSNEIKYLNDEMQSYTVSEEIKIFLKLDKDNILYIDYIKEFIREYLEFEEDYKNFIEEKTDDIFDCRGELYQYYFENVISKIKTLIIKGINENADMEVILKYIWLKEYYNKTLISLGGNKENKAYIT